MAPPVGLYHGGTRYVSPTQRAPVHFVNPKVVEHRGRVVKNTGDGLLAEFGSAVDAMRCAMDIQRGMAKRNAEVPQESRIDFRIGINIGDIILDHGDIFGDGVNVAARLERVADPGGICMSDDVVKLVRGRVAGDFVCVGEGSGSSRTSCARSAYIEWSSISRQRGRRHRCHICRQPPLGTPRARTRRH
jgi:class 3 adenylate cyclase